MSKIFNLVYRSVCAGYDYARLQGKNPSMTADLETIANNIVDSLNLADFEDETTDNQSDEKEETDTTLEQTNTDEEATEELPPEAVKDQVSNYLQSLVMLKNEAKHTEEVTPKTESSKPTYKDELREKLEEKFKQYHEEHPELDHPAENEEPDTPYFEPVKVETEPNELPSGYTNIMGNSVKNEPIDTPIHPVNEDTIRIEKEDLANITEKVEETSEVKEKNLEENTSFDAKPFIESKEEQPLLNKEKLPEINLESIKPKSEESKPIEYATKKNNIYNDSAFNLTGVIHGIIGSLKSDPRIKNYNQQGYEILPTDLLFLSTHQTNRHLGIILRLIDKKTGKLSYKYVIYELALNNGKGKIYNVTDKFERILPSLDKFTETKANWKAETQELYEKELSEISNAYIKDAFIDEMRSNYMKWLRDQIVYRPTDLTPLFQYMIKKF